MPNLPGNILKELCCDARKLLIVAPYIKANFLTEILSDINSEASIICVTRWKPKDIEVGVSDTECRTIVKNHGGTFRLHQSLHAKYYRIDNKVLIGSANLTYPAMGWAKESNLEILCTPGDDFNSDDFEQNLLKGSSEINNNEFAIWSAITPNIKTQSDNISHSDGQPLLDTWKPRTRDPQHLILLYQDKLDKISSDGEIKAAMSDINSLQIPQGYTEEQIAYWMFACLYASPFGSDVIKRDIKTDDEKVAESFKLSEIYGTTPTHTKRSIETIQIWLNFLEKYVG